MHFFQANHSKSQLPTTKGLALSFGFKKSIQTNKIRPISAPAKSIEKSNNCGSKMLPKPTFIETEKYSKSTPKNNTPSPNRFVTYLIS